MILEFVPIASQVSGVLLVMVVGAIARRLGWLSSKADQSLAVLTSNILLPAFFLHKIVIEPSSTALSSTWLPPLLGFTCTTLGFGIAWAMVKLVGPWFGMSDPIVQRTFVLTAGIANYGYIPLPLAQRFFKEAEIPLLLHNVGVDIALWSIGVLVISGELGNGWKRILQSVPLWALAVAMAIQQLGYGPWIPGPIKQMSTALGMCAIPLGLLLGGAIIIDYWRDVKWREAIPVLTLACIVRILILPVLFLVIASKLNRAGHLNEVLLLQASMPAATFPIVLTRLYEGDLRTALRVVVGTSILGLITIPIWIVLGKYWLGLN